MKQRAAAPREEYGWEYRRVSVIVSILQFAAATTPNGCRLFQLAATRRRRSGKTFNPKVAGSIPARPTLSEALALQLSVRRSELGPSFLAARFSLRFSLSVFVAFCFPCFFGFSDRLLTRATHSG